MPGAVTPGAAVMPSGAAIASAALKYAGSGYAYGGRADHPGDWDCSSFVSYVLGHDLGMTLPGGKRFGDPGVPPNAHGPVVLDYASWAGATTLPAGSSPAAGDLCVWPGAGPVGHIGIAVDSAHMVSALDHTDGTLHSPIAGFGPAGARLVYRRVNGAGQAAGGAGPSGPLGGLAGLPGAGIVAGLLVGGGIPLLMIGAILAGTAVLGLAGALVVTAAVRGQDGR